MKENSVIELIVGIISLLLIFGIIAASVVFLDDIKDLFPDESVEDSSGGIPSDDSGTDDSGTDDSGTDDSGMDDSGTENESGENVTDELHHLTVEDARYRLVDFVDENDCYYLEFVFDLKALTHYTLSWSFDSISLNYALKNDVDCLSSKEEPIFVGFYDNLTDDHILVDASFSFEYMTDFYVNEANFNTGKTSGYKYFRFFKICKTNYKEAEALAIALMSNCIISMNVDQRW